MPPEASIQPVYAIVGPDRFIRVEALTHLLDTISHEMETVNPVRYDGSTVEPAEVLDPLRTPSLLGDRSVVVLDEADAFLKSSISAEKKKGAASRKTSPGRKEHRPRRLILERYCANPTRGSTLILLCQSLPKNTKLYRIINEQGRVIQAPAMTGRAVIPWIMQRAADRYQKKIERGAALRLREQLGESPGVLDAELSKLATYVGGRTDITPADIDALTGHLREENVFAVIDAIVAHDTDKALAQWEQVLATDRAAPGRAIAGLAWSVRRLLAARRDYEAGVPISALAQNHRIFMDHNALERLLDRISIAELESQQSDLLAADLAVKTSGSTLERAVERFIINHSRAGTSSRLVSA